MPNKTDSLEIVHEGWLTKSPPTKRIWRARWRKRWFVLRHSGELPGQYYLCYYTDKNCRTLKGRIDLDQCEQVDAGLQFESNKHKYQYMFDVRTPKRTYYLAAETESDMNKWVECICQVCGLKAISPEENEFPNNHGSEESSSLAGDSLHATESPPVSPSSTASSPYIPISECITGKPIGNIYQDDFYDSPRKLKPPSDLELRASGSTSPPLQSPGTDGESVFTDEEWSNSRPSVNWDTFPHPSDSSVEEVKPSLFVGKRRYTKPVAPPRPPKPQHLVLQELIDKHTYTNLDEDSPKIPAGQSSENVVNEMYDFPRSHQLNGEQENIDPVPAPRSRHYYSNAAPSGTVFSYDFADYSGDEPVSPHSEASSSAHYSNVSSPNFSTNPPIVDRGLKPGRKASDSVSNEPSPNVDLNQLRHLKPVPAARSRDEHVTLKLCAPPARRSESKYNSSNKRYHNTHSPTYKSFGEAADMDSKIDDHEQKFALFGGLHSRENSKHKEIQYLDLDLDSTENGSPSTSENSVTVYKEVDFVKTEAFNRTRQKVEEERKQIPDVV